MLKALVLNLFKKNVDYGPNILLYIESGILGNIPLRGQIHELLETAVKLGKNTPTIMEGEFYTNFFTI